MFHFTSCCSESELPSSLVVYLLDLIGSFSRLQSF